MRVLPASVAAACAAALLASGCSKEPDATGTRAGGSAAAPAQTQAELDTPIAKIDDVVITVGEFQERINKQSPYIRARYNSVEQKKEFLDALIRYEVLAREAYRRGYDKDPEAVRAMKTVMIQKLMKAEFDAAVRPEDIPDAELRAYYDAHPEEWNKPEEVRVSAIILADEATAAKVAKLALGDEGKSNKGFRDLVARHSVDETSKLVGGDLRYFSQGTKDVPAPVVTAAFTLDKTGMVAGPIDAGDGRHYVIKQTGRRRAITRTYDQVKRQIQNTLWKDRRVTAQQAFVAELEKKSTIEVFDAALQKVQVAPAGEGDGDGHDHGGGSALPAIPGVMDDPAPTPAPPATPAGDDAKEVQP